MKYSRKEGLREGRSLKDATSQSIGTNAFIRRMVLTRSGYFTVRSLPKTHESTEFSNSSDFSTKKSGKQDSQLNVTTRVQPKEVVTALDTPEAALNASLPAAITKDLLKKNWREDNDFSNEEIFFISSPFKFGLVHQLVSSRSYLELLTKEVSSLSYDSLCNDLYEFEQSHDLLKSELSTPALNSFVQFLRGPLLKWMQDVTGLELSGKITATASKYSYTNYLLCHDDNLSDRCVAFIFYLCDDWDYSDGGALQLFECNDQDQPTSVAQCVWPSFGSFAFFHVCSTSYHEVQEVFSKDKIRLSINGWFHGNQLPCKPVFKFEPILFQPPSYTGRRLLKKFISSQYLQAHNHADIKSQFSYELSVCLPNFLLRDSYNDLAMALKSRKIAWELCGPAHFRNYERAEIFTLPNIMQEFLRLLQSKLMFYFLSEVTVDINPDSETTPMWHLEVQRWSPGDYTVVVDGDPSCHLTGIDVHLYFNVPSEMESDHSSSGNVSYLGPDKDSNGFLEQNALVEPENNSLFLVARVAGMKCVTKYINHACTSVYHKIHATYTQG